MKSGFRGLKLSVQSKVKMKKKTHSMHYLTFPCVWFL